MVSKEVLDILACPLCRADVKLVYSERNESAGGKLACVNPECLCKYRIEDDIPIMLIDEAERLCPKCNTQRDWLEEKNLLKCPKCGCELRAS